MPTPYRIPVPQMNDNIAVYGNRVYLNGGMKRYYVYDAMKGVIGRGGMGEVYHGYDCRTGEPVAIKKLYTRYCNVPSFRQKARQESNLVFSHKNIVEMLGYCEFRDGRGPIFVISSYVPGDNADTYIEKQGSVFLGPDRAEKIIRLLMPILDALEFLHRQRIYHLDIKPTNIMIDRFSTARLMDLGLANTTMATAGFGENEFGVLGTPRFAAPEQFNIPGQPSKVDATSDLYEFAVTLYELITTRNPFEGDNFRDTADRHFHGYLSADDAIPDAVLTVLQKATEVQQNRRYPTAAALRSALAEALVPKKKKWNPLSFLNKI